MGKGEKENSLNYLISAGAFGYDHYRFNFLAIPVELALILVGFSQVELTEVHACLSCEIVLKECMGFIMYLIV